MNQDLYWKIKNELNGALSDNLSADGIRDLLNHEITFNKQNRKDLITVFVCYYEFFKGKENLKVLEDYCKNVFPTLFNYEFINDNYSEIIKDEKLLNILMEFCDDEFINELFKKSLSDKQEYDILLEIANKYNRKTNVKFKEEKENITLQADFDNKVDDYDFDHFMPKTSSDISEELVKVQEKLNQCNLEYQQLGIDKSKQAIKAYDTKSPEEFRILADQIDKLKKKKEEKESLELKKRNLQHELEINGIREQRKLEKEKGEAVNNVQNEFKDTDISKRDIRKTVDKKISGEYDKIVLSEDMKRSIDDNKLISLSKSKLEKFISRLSLKLQLRNATLEVDELDDKKVTINNSKKSQKIANCANWIVKKIAKARQRRQIVNKFFLSVKENGVKEVIKTVAEMNYEKEDKKLAGQEEYNSYKEDYNKIMDRTDKLIEEMNKGTVKAVGGTKVDEVINVNEQENSNVKVA